MYKITENGVIRVSDNALIPKAVGNRDWTEYQRWLEEDGGIPEPEFTEEQIKFNYRKEIESVRYEAEVLGVSIDGMTILSDRDTQMKLTSSALRAQRDPGYSLDWKCTDGSFIHLTGDEIITVADLVGDYVQACYSRESELNTILDKGEYEEDMLYEGWPSNVLTMKKGA